jgi:O-antigen chain-terminating methyltransferase
MSDQFYRAFEERYYASQATIKSLRRQYLPFVEPLAHIYPGAGAFDAGCGRGEWLELMQECGFDAHGVDLDEGMLSACKAKGLKTTLMDAVTALSQISSESQAVVSAFHVVEHMPFDALRVFVDESIRVLKPGGILIMETPNPENILVATRNFFLDPTHIRPIPQELLTFIAGFAGFKRVKVLRMQEDTRLFNQADVTLRDVLFGASPDYAVISQKPGPQDELAALDSQFDREYGLSIDRLLNRFEERLIRLEHTAREALHVSQTAHNAELRELLWLSKQIRLLRREGLWSRIKVLLQKARSRVSRYSQALASHIYPKLIRVSCWLGVNRFFFEKKIDLDQESQETVEVFQRMKSVIDHTSKRRD